MGIYKKGVTRVRQFRACEEQGKNEGQEGTFC